METTTITNQEQRQMGDTYSVRWYEVNKEAVARLKTLNPTRPVLDALNAWFWIFVIVKTYLFFPQLLWWYPLAIFLIAGRAGVFLQLAHEAAHKLIGKGAFNDWFGNWAACYPIGLDLRGYGEPHMRHHACTNKPCDPLTDSEKYKVCNIKDPKLWLLCLKDLLGITAISTRLQYDETISNKHQKEVEDYLEHEGYATYQAPFVSTGGGLQKYLSISLVQLLILGFLFNFNPLHYFFLWLIPLVTVHMFLMRIRGIAEHGLGIQLGVPDLDQRNLGTFYTRSFGTPMSHYRIPGLNLLERWLIGSLDVYYHHEHHLYPKVPYYNLPKIHALIAPQMKKHNPRIFAKGYFDSLFVNLREPTSSSSHT